MAGKRHSDEDYAERSLILADDVAWDMTSSMNRDLERINRLEVPWLSGGWSNSAAKLEFQLRLIELFQTFSSFMLRV